MTTASFLSYCLAGISIGGIYALIAIGYTMVYGILRLINFAHGDIFMMAAYFMIFAMVDFALPWYVSMVIMIVATVILGVVIEKVAYKPLREAPRMSIMISAIGVSYLLQNVATYFFSALPKQYPDIPILNQTITLGEVSTSIATFITPIITLIFVILLMLLIKYTKIGMAMRAVSKDFETAKLMGVQINTVITMTFVIGCFLAAVGSMLYFTPRPSVFPMAGSLPGLKCFIAAVFGGIGSIPGAVVGGFVIGLCETFIKAAGYSEFSDVFTFALLIVVLMFKPTGLFGETMEEKV
ncbi:MULTISPECIES: branched-chain amino acid ABC transporter permease [Eubacterium]|uniref:Amino acid/amide ABC transporter membrane protein 1, HAAT family n=2 Tax=Eubacterium TaxID=1730 RepID=A0A1H4E4G6_9FIRM|nr:MULTISPECIES: branched-chain amino acid ABC transporter permease [Eubacterium]MDD4691001.1 branched-chain amino acid ABC transporter permease [Eubacterium aggregans]MEA5074196.1 branched-chain amino acid ABC transporter permease [Eubacterium aggregans]SDY07546.1 amino acid/amide ABC transporter membrane protein 1, HAAT family [Eubacterium barkeri]SEA79806.1 amino acid/amide ABC transporter membrane protein 1, HAAT family [Eubacterium aggregans]